MAHLLLGKPLLWRIGLVAQLQSPRELVDSVVNRKRQAERLARASSVARSSSALGTITSRHEFELASAGSLSHLAVYQELTQVSVETTFATLGFF